jgi:hypothetical protein
MYRPKHRAPQGRRRPALSVALTALRPARPFAAASIAAIALAAAMSPGAYAAEPGGPPGHTASAHSSTRSADDPGKGSDGTGEKEGKKKGRDPDKDKLKSKSKSKSKGPSAVGKPSRGKDKDDDKGKDKGKGEKPGKSSTVGKPAKAKTRDKTKTDDKPRTDDKSKDKTKDDSSVDDEGHGLATNGGHALLGDAGKPLEKLAATAAPLTAYEMPFPCGEVWTGSTRAGHSPSIRAVDFNFAGGDLGKPVIAAASGTVVTAVVGKNRPSYGQYVVVDHGNGESTLYAHLDSVTVYVGQTITMGTQLGTVGDTGNSFGSHLHFEERLNGAVVDAWFHGAPFPMNSYSTSQNCGVGGVVQQRSTDLPIAGNLYGGKAAKVGVYRPSAGSFLISRPGKSDKTIRLGDATSQPVLGDWDGNGKANPGVRNPKTKTFTLRVKRSSTTIKLGGPNDLPVAGNWDGVGGWEVGVFRPGKAKFILRNADGSKTKVKLGDGDDLPVTGDWNGDGITDLGVYDMATATFTLNVPDAAAGTPTTTVQFGTAGDLPVVGDWNGDRVTELGTWNPYTAVFSKRGVDVPANAPAGALPKVKHVVFGRIGD